jgi:PAS domain S-box-containing protein
MIDRNWGEIANHVLGGKTQERSSVCYMKASLSTKSGAKRHRRQYQRDKLDRKNYLLSTMHAIAEHERVEEELRRSEAYLAQAQRLSHTGSWALNVSTGELFWSQEHFRIVGLDPETAKPSYPTSLQVTHPEDRSFVQEKLETAIRERTDFKVDCRIVRPDGTIRHIHSLANPVFNQSGELIEYVGTIIDVTERKQAEALLRQANARSEMILDSITDRFFAFDKNWRFTYFNKHSTEQMKILGKDPVKLIGKVLWEEFPEVPNEKALRRVMSERVAITDQLYSAPLGEWVENHMYPSQDGGLVTFQKYITSRKRTEEKLHQTQAELAHVTRASTMGELAASIAHEINQPLGAIVNNSNVCLQLVGATGSEERKREALLDIVNDANRASAIIARIRALTKGSAPETIPLGLKDVVADVLVLAQRELLENRIFVKTELAKDLPLISGDRVQLQQVLLNLVMNAIEAMSAVAANRRFLTVRAKRDELEGEPVVLISVQDSGTGLRPEDMHRLFQPFHSTKPHGMGMGLRIARSIVEGFGGRLWAKRDTGPGATFCCALPIEKVSLGNAAEPNAKVD